MLEAGHTPQHLLAHLNNEAGLEAAVQREISLLQRQGLHDLASGLQQRAGLPRSATRAAGGLQHYAQGAIWRARLQRLNQERGVQELARSRTTREVLARAAALLDSQRVNSAVHLLCSKAEACPYSPALEQALAEAAEAEENWLAALEHWQQIVGGQGPVSIKVHAQQRLNELTICSPLKQQRVVMKFDHLLFQEGVLTHAGPEPPPFASTKEAAAAFWQHDAKAEALLSPEINPLIWTDFRHDSCLQHAARYWLVQKLFYGRCLLEAIANDGGVPIQAMARRCAVNFDPAHYLKQLNPGTTVSADSALTDYLSKGWTRNLDPSPTFNTTAALERDPLLRQFGINPLYATLCSGDAAGQQEQLTGQALMQRFPDSTYFNPKFTWFTASPPGDHSCLDLHWVVDDFNPSSEGHTSIVPMLRQLEQQGHRITVWELNPDHNQHGQPIQATVLELDASFFFSSGDAVIATSRSTLDVVRKAKGFKARFHCIQDGEASAETDGLTFLSLGQGKTESEAFQQGLFERLSAVAPNRTCDGIRLQWASAADAEPPRFKAAVVLPTHNAGPILQPVLNALKAQTTPWEFQCVLIDSASTDGTLEQLQGFAEQQAHVSVHRINQAEFQHGHTRNRGVAWSDAEFVAFLTQDAIPADDHWLVNLVSALEHQPDAAGCFGRHVAHDDAPLLIRQELERYFSALEQFPKALSLHTEPDRIKQKDQFWRQILHFYSDNNSCLRKSIWNNIPLPCIPFGEDQLWAEAIIRRGYTKVYAADAVVKHSHNYSAEETYNRARIEAEFYATCFGHSIHTSRTGMDQAISRDCCDAVNRAIEAEGRCSSEHLVHQLECIIAKHCGGDPALQHIPQASAAHPISEQLECPKPLLNFRAKSTWP